MNAQRVGAGDGNEDQGGNDGSGASGCNAEMDLSRRGLPPQEGRSWRLQEFETRIRFAMKSARELGWDIAPGVTIAEGVCCPIGALEVACKHLDPIGEEYEDQWAEIAAHHCGLTEPEADSFAYGFDGTAHTELGAYVKQYYELGAQMRVEWLSANDGILS